MEVRCQSDSILKVLKLLKKILLLNIYTTKISFKNKIGCLLPVYLVAPTRLVPHANKTINSGQHTQKQLKQPPTITGAEQSSNILETD